MEKKALYVTLRTVKRIIISCLIAISAAGCGREDAANEVPTEKAAVGDVRVEVSGRGELRALASHIVRMPNLQGGWRRMQIMRLVKEGTFVKPGDRLFKVDTNEMEEKLKRLITEARSKHADFLNAQKVMELERQRLDSTVSKLDERFRARCIDLNLLLMDPGTIKALTARTAYELAKMNAVHALDAYKPAKELASMGFVSGADLEKRKLELDRARAAEILSELNYEQVMTGSEPIEIEQARVAVISALNSLQQAESNRALRMLKQRMTVENARWEWLRKQRNVERIQESLKKSDVKSETQGVVVYEMVYVGRGKREKVKNGQSVHRRARILRVDDTSKLVMRAEIEESEILKVRKGMRARVYIDALPGRSFTGTVTEIARISHDRGEGNNSATIWNRRESSGTRVFDVDILLDQIGDELKPGLNGSATIIADTLESVLSVPIESVFREGDNDLVHVKVPSGWEDRVVSVSQRTLDRAVISGGLDEGEEVATADPYGMAGTNGVGKGGLEIVRQMTVERTTLPLVITETGKLRPRDYVMIKAPISGEITHLAEEGARVKKGDVILKIDDSAAREELVGASIGLKSALAQLEYARLEKEHTRRTYERDSQQLKAELHLAQAGLRDLIERPTDEEKRIAEVELEYDRIEMEGARRSFERTKALATKGLVSGVSLSEARLKKEQAEASYEKTKVEYELLLKGALEDEIEVQRQKVRKAEIALNECLANLPIQVNLKRTAKVVDQLYVDRVKADIERHQRLVDSATVTAPTDGTVIYRVRWERPEEGLQVWGGDGLIELTDMTRMVATTRTHEVDLRRVRIGQKALIRLEAMPDRTFHGRVVSIAGLATDKSEGSGGILERQSTGVMVFNVTVEIEEKDPNLRPGFTASIDLITDELPDKLTVPLSFLQRHNGGTAVYVKSNGALELRTVKTGRQGSRRIAIEEGLREGEVVCMVRRSQ